MAKRSRIKRVAYARTSTGKQTLGIDVQIEAFKQYQPDVIFKEHVSGRKESRKQLDKALSCLKREDTLIVYKLDRLSRSTRQLVNMMADLEDRGINLIIIKEGIDTSTSMGKVVFTIMAAIAEMEAERISERTREALALTSKALGNPGIAGEKEAMIVRLYQDHSLTLKEIATRCCVSVKTVYNVSRKYGLSRRR